MRFPLLRWIKPRHQRHSSPSTAPSATPSTANIAQPASSQTVSTFPKQLTVVVAAICILPFLLNLIGIDFASDSASLSGDAVSSLSASQLTEAMHHALEGSYTHTILEWSAFCTAIFTTLLAFACFANKPDVATPILGVALLCAGIMDAFHTLAADRLVEAVADNGNLIPFTWALCRLFNALISIIGTGLLLFFNFGRNLRFNATIVAAISGFFMLLAYITIQACANSHNLPQTTFPNALITRPWDIAPLFLFLGAGLWLYPAFYQKYPSIFSSALIVSTIPNVATQLHMAFGSTALFDNHFNIAHFLKIIAYLVPLTGLILDYVYTYGALEKRNNEFFKEIHERKSAESKLQLALTDLKQTQVQLIQSEKMSGLGQMVSGIAHEINNPVNFIHGNLKHLNTYFDDLLSLSRLYQEAYPEPVEAVQQELEELDLAFLKKDLPKLLKSMNVGTERIREIVKSLRTFSRLDEAAVKQADIHEGLESTLMILQHRLEATSERPAVAVVRCYDKLPMVECYAGQLNQVFMNIMTNALDAMEGKKNTEPSTLTLATQSCPERQEVVITIGDNGEGIPSAILNKIFDPFFTTKPVGKGTGLGMSISHQIITEHHQGSLTCHSTLGHGTEFTLTIPTVQKTAQKTL
ncbi:MAG: ATP-binding protein [Cyanobacteria bacterium P01_F01_bin.53]